MTQDKVMSADAASKVLGVSERTARRYCEENKLAYQMKGKI